MEIRLIPNNWQTKVILIQIIVIILAIGYGYTEHKKLKNVKSDISTQIQPEKSRAYNNLAVEQIKKNQLESAMQNLETALVLNPRFSQAHTNYGLCLYQYGNIDLALIHFRLGVEYDPANMQALYNLSLCLLMMEKWTEAITAFERYVHFQPKDYIAYNYMGEAYKAIGNSIKAVEYFDKSVSTAKEYEHLKTREN